MRRRYRTKKEIEKHLIREVLKGLGYKISNIKRSWQERPDAMLTLIKGGKRKRVGIELMDYFNDTTVGIVSPLTIVKEFWKQVHTSLMRRISHRKHLGVFAGDVKFKDNVPTPNGNIAKARSLAKELVDFLELHHPEISDIAAFNNYNGDFDRFSILTSLCDSIRISRCADGQTFMYQWKCTDIHAGFIGINQEYIKTAVKKKNKKAAEYENWEGADETWLVITAGAQILSNHAGSRPKDTVWADPKLQELCNKSIFDRIIFWESVSGWYKWLKPDEEVVELASK